MHWLIGFVLCFWEPRSHHQAAEVRAIVEDVATTDGTPFEQLELLNIAALESGFERSAIGKLGERGPFQQLGGDYDPQHPAREALRRLRAQGLIHFMGCPSETEACMLMAANRSAKAAVWLGSTIQPEAEGRIAQDESRGLRR